MAEESKAAEPCLNVLTEENLQQMTKKKRSFSETGTQVSGGSEENSKEMKEADTSNENTAGSSTSSAHSNNMNAEYPPPKKAKFDLKGANVIDLTADAPVVSSSSSQLQTSEPSGPSGPSGKGKTEEHESEEDEDVVLRTKVQEMKANGRGVYCHANCILEVKESGLIGSGRGVWIKEGEIICNGECITQYSGRKCKTTKIFSTDQLLYSIELDDKTYIEGKKELSDGDGCGSLMNSAVVGRCLSLVSFRMVDNECYAFAKTPERYPLKGPLELFVTAGVGWWKEYRRVYER